MITTATSSFHSMPEPGRRKGKVRRASIVKKTIAQTKTTRKRESGGTKTILSQTIKRRVELRSWHELEPWQKDNEFLLTGYRPPTNSYRLSLHSLLYIHNQTANIYSHLVGCFLAILSIFFTTFVLAPRYQTADWYDIGVFGAFGAGALLCFGFSAFFHAVGNHSHGVYEKWLLWDLYGILVLICGTVYSGTYYGFYCEEKVWITYSIEITLITILGGSICTIPRFRVPKWRFMRALLFGVIFLSGAVPMTHAINRFGREQAAKQMGWDWLLTEACLYVTGAVLYATRFPERLKPGAFDIWCSSHQLFHVFAVLGAAFHLIGMVKAFDYNHNPMTRRC